jgi:hypothetical protein
MCGACLLSNFTTASALSPSNLTSEISVVKAFSARLEFRSKCASMALSTALLELIPLLHDVAAVIASTIADANAFRIKSASECQR